MRISYLVPLSLLCFAFSAWADNIVTLDGKDQGRTFDGIGALSAGASSRLLIDYPEPQRSEILDYLFKPNFGAALQINKVEIGGDMNSTDGSEPSHMFTRDEENYTRGYEWWLMEESKKRNPSVKLYGLEWGAPGWVNPVKNDVWTDDNITFILKWVQHAKSDHHLDIDYLGGWNERGYNTDWNKKYRKALNDAGYSSIKIIADDSFSWDIGKSIASDPDFAKSFEIVGEHYPGEVPGKNLPKWEKCVETGKPLWGSEIGSAGYNGGAFGLAKLYNQGYIGSKMTAYINWSTIWSVLAGMPYNGDGLLLANEPWSGHYEVGLSIWATAHTTQFAQPGWQYMDHACLLLPKRGSCVGLRSPDGHDFSLVVETVDCKEPQTITFSIANGLPTGPLHVWRTDMHANKTEKWFIQQPDITPVNGSVSLTFDPACLYSITTLTTPHKGVTAPPAHTMLPLPFHDDFQSYELGATPKYFSDQHGTFEVQKAGGGREGKCFRQMITVKPVTWNRDADPASMIGDPTWRNYMVSCDALLGQPGYVELIGRMEGTGEQNKMMGYHFQLADTGHWSLRTEGDKKSPSREIANGTFSKPIGTGTWHKLSLSFLGTQIAAAIDDMDVVTALEDKTYTHGLVGVQVNRWQTAEFMNFQVTPNGPQATGDIQRTSLVSRGAKIVEVDSQAPGYDASNALDGDPSTFWHTVYEPKSLPFPHHITVDLGKVYTLRGISYLPRQDMETCRTADCDVFLSNDLNNWGDPAATATLENSGDVQTILFKQPTSGRYLKFVAKSSHNSDPNTAIAELDILE